MYHSYLRLLTGICYYMLPIGFLYYVLLFSLAFSAHAQQLRTTTYSNGTGFYVTKDGYIVTNAHVVRECKSNIAISGIAPGEAQIVARDDDVDLALLKARDYAPAIGYLRINEGELKAGDDLIVMGYAGEQGASGHYSFVKSKLIDTHGPQGQSHWLQFSNAAQKGNSGGPLLDTSGHVIGVISGKTQLFRVDDRSNVAPVKVSESDVAITLDALKYFLDAERIRYQTASSGLLQFSDNRLESDAHNFIVQLKCITAQN